MISYRSECGSLASQDIFTKSPRIADGQSPTKRDKRLFHDPEHIPSLEKVFSEYDWQNQTYSPTLRDPASPILDPAASFPSKPSKWTKRSPSCISDVGSSSPRRMLDDSLTSSFLLSDSSSPPSEFNRWMPYSYPASPIAHEDSFQSPLQLSTLVQAEADREYQFPHHPLTRAVTQPRLRRKCRPRPVETHSDAVIPKVASSLSSETTMPVQRSRSSTWCSDLTAVGVEGTTSCSLQKGSMGRPIAIYPGAIDGSAEDEKVDILPDIDSCSVVCINHISRESTEVSAAYSERIISPSISSNAYVRSLSPSSLPFDDVCKQEPAVHSPELEDSFHIPLLQPSLFKRRQSRISSPSHNVPRSFKDEVDSDELERDERDALQPIPLLRNAQQSPETVIQAMDVIQKVPREAKKSCFEALGYAVRYRCAAIVLKCQLGVLRFHRKRGHGKQ